MSDFSKDGIIKINDVEFSPLPGVKYKHDYAYIAHIIATPSEWRKFVALPDNFPDTSRMTLAETTKILYADENITLNDYVERILYRFLILNDLWFILYFVIGIQIANHPFVVKMCRTVEDGPKTNTLDIWSRYHFKSSVITVAETVQYHLRNPEHCTCIFSFRLDSAEGFLLSIKNVFEKQIIKLSFPDIVYAEPDKRSPSWGLKGLTLQRKNTARKEATIEASGLVDGAPTGGRYERKVFDDIETDKIARSAEEMDKCFKSFEMASYLGTGRDTDIDRIVGTFYNHAGPLVRIMEKKINGEPAFITRIVPGTHNGQANGKPVLMSEKQLAKEKAGMFFDSQILCNPTPSDSRKFNSDDLREIEPTMIPRDIVQFLLVDPAGDNENGKPGDSWGIMVIGIDVRNIDELGASNIYIMKALITPLGKSQAVEEVARMYMASGVINAIGIEKQPGAVNYLDQQIKEVLEKKGKRLSIEDKSLVLLPIGGRHKATKILNALDWRFSNGKIHISKSVPVAYRERLKMEMDKFPFWHDDGLDTISYFYDLIKEVDLTRVAVSDQYDYSHQKQYAAVI